MTPDEMSLALQQYGFTLRRVAAGWLAETAKGTRLHRDPKPTPEEAVAAAKAAVEAAGARDAELRAGRLLAALATGRYFLRSRKVAGVDELGNPTETLVFDGLLPNNTLTTVRARTDYAQAVADLEALIP